MIEVLVVIAIIAILAALLPPALAKSKSQALIVECNSHLKQWGPAEVMYAGDNYNSFPDNCLLGRLTIFPQWAGPRPADIPPTAGVW
jgi:hypothetical protein